jgi:hypothetical protein
MSFITYLASDDNQQGQPVDGQLIPVDLALENGQESLNTATEFNKFISVYEKLNRHPCISRDDTGIIYNLTQSISTINNGLGKDHRFSNFVRDHVDQSVLKLNPNIINKEFGIKTNQGLNCQCTRDKVIYETLKKTYLKGASGEVFMEILMEREASIESLCAELAVFGVVFHYTFLTYKLLD